MSSAKKRHLKDVHNSGSSVTSHISDPVPKKIDCRLAGHLPSSNPPPPVVLGPTSPPKEACEGLRTIPSVFITNNVCQEEPSVVITNNVYSNIHAIVTNNIGTPGADKPSTFNVNLEDKDGEKLAVHLSLPQPNNGGVVNVNIQGQKKFNTHEHIPLKAQTGAASQGNF